MFSRNNEVAYKMYNPDDNDNFSELKGEKLRNLISLLDDYYIEMKDTIGIDSNITIGIEIEYDNADQEKVREIVDQSEFVAKLDGSVPNGIEINSPIMTDCTASWQKLDDILKKISPYVSGGKMRVYMYIYQLMFWDMIKMF